MKKALRLFHTVRHLQAKQLAYRLYYRLRRLTLSPNQHDAEARKWLHLWFSPQWQASSLLTDGQFLILNESGDINSPTDWNNPAKSKLWLYNLHYLDVLNAQGSDTRIDELNELIDRWIGDNPVLQGNGWEPYPLSLRLVNLVKWQMRDNYQGCKLLNSIQLQAVALSKQIEYHILANHLFANAKALVFSGVTLAGGDELLQQGLAILDKEIAEQFLADGGHFELSPMYHATLLWDMCDLCNLAKVSDFPALQTRKQAWKEVIQRGLVWLSNMCHFDGGIAFFNDSTFGVAPTYADLCRYAEYLGIQHSLLNDPSLSVTHLQNTGYVCIESDLVTKLIVDVGQVGPAYQPGHAHADTLSFEFSLFGQRVFVNSGISQYGVGRERSYQRSTRAHNTVVVDGKNSSDIWGGFRVGQRAKPQRFQMDRTRDQVTVSCAHDGYSTLLNPLNHLREWRFSQRSCTIVDRLSGRYKQAEARYYLHPDVKITAQDSQDSQGLQCVLPSGETISVQFIHHAALQIIDTQWYPGFGLEQANHCVIATFNQKPLQIDIAW